MCAICSCSELFVWHKSLFETNFCVSFEQFNTALELPDTLENVVLWFNAVNCWIGSSCSMIVCTFSDRPWARQIMNLQKVGRVCSRRQDLGRQLWFSKCCMCWIMEKLHQGATYGTRAQQWKLSYVAFETQPLPIPVLPYVFTLIPTNLFIVKVRSMCFTTWLQTKTNALWPSHHCLSYHLSWLTDIHTFHQHHSLDMKIANSTSLCQSCQIWPHWLIKYFILWLQTGCLNQGKVQSIVEDILEQRLAGQTYDPLKAAQVIYSNDITGISDIYWRHFFGDIAIR